MTRLAKATSAFSHGQKVFVLCLVVVAMNMLALVPAASAAPKSIQGFIGGEAAVPPKAFAGLFLQPRDVAVYEGTDDDTATDKIFVVEAANNNMRVQRLDADGNFERMWGKDVLANGTANTGAEICVVAADCQAPESGGTGSLPGEFDDPTGMAVDQANAWVYVYDRDNKRIQKFDLDGNFILMFGDNVNATTTGDVCTQASGDTCQKGTGGAAVGQIGPSGSTSNQVRGLAVDPVTSDVFVADPSNRRIQRFNSDGTLDASPTLGSAGTGLGQFGTNQPLHIAVDSAGIVYASDSAPTTSTQRLNRYDSATSTAIEAVASPPLLSNGTTPTVGLEVDPDSDGAGADEEHLLVARDPGTSGQATVVQEFDIPAVATDPITAGQLVDTHTYEVNQAINGLGVSGGSGNVYLAVAGLSGLSFPACGCAPADGTAIHGVMALNVPGSAPTADVGSPTSVTTTTADLTGEIVPGGGGVVSYQFEYSSDGLTFAKAGTPRYASGGELVPASQALSGLTPNTLYRARLVARRVTALTTASIANSPEAVILTDGAPPGVTTMTTSQRGSSTATLLARINPNGAGTTYYFEYGKTTAYGNKQPIPAGNLVAGPSDRIVSTDVAGLQPDTAYHYRVVAENPSGLVKGQDVGFQTRPVASDPPQRAYEMVTPPFKASRANVQVTHPEYNVNLGLPSLDGDAVAWATFVFPLTDDVGAATNWDIRRIGRTSAGWAHRTLNTLKTLGSFGFGTSQSGLGGSGDLGTFAWHTRDAILPHAGTSDLQSYVRRDGTGTKGFTKWFDDTNAHVSRFGLKTGEPYGSPALLNDGGTAMVRADEARDLVEDPGTATDEDPSGEQQLFGKGSSVGSSAFGGRTIYHVQALNPDDLPSAPKDLVNECSGSGPDATELPARVGTGAATDTIGTQACTESDGTPDATGTGTVAHNSPTVTGLNTESGAFGVGQIVSGEGISGATRITAVGAGTLTLSANVTAKASIFAQLTDGSNQIVVQFSQIGTPEVGQRVSGPGIPPGTTVEAISGTTLTLSQAATATSSFTAILFDAPGPVIDLSAEAQHLTSARGAGLGSGRGPGVGTISNPIGPVATALSDTGKRVFFASPDPVAEGFTASFPCTSATGFATSCPPQLFVRQYDANGESPQVRWISRSRSNPVGEGGYDGAMIAGQQIAEMGTAIFQGASRDGSVAYFATNSPLTPDDPNAGKSITTDSAQDNSWDLYRYELPPDLSLDPDDGVLTRVSGGPSGNADPDASPGGATLRFLSDDGERALFVTRAPIAGADTVAPKGGSTAPGGTVGSGSIRNLYLFDSSQSGANRYRFIAQLPASGDWNACATTTSQLGRQIYAHSSSGFSREALVNCFRGTPDGSHVLFSTRGQLTADDDDDVGDLYLYDAEADELIRVTAPPAGAVPYPCKVAGSIADNIEHPINDCNGQLSFTGIAEEVIGSETARGWGGLRYENIAKGPDGVVSVFFESRSQLVPEDVNGNRMDVYQWREGELSLISPGDSNDNSWFSGNSVDGRDVFFVTHKPIDPREIDPKDPDIYDARVGGGFPYTPPPAPCDVLALACEREAAPAPASRTTATAGFVGAGNLAPVRSSCEKTQLRRSKRCVSKRALARRACRKLAGKAKRRCLRKQLRRLNRQQKRSQKRAGQTGRASR